MSLLDLTGKAAVIIGENSTLGVTMAEAIAAQVHRLPLSDAIWRGRGFKSLVD